LIATPRLVFYQRGFRSLSTSLPTRADSCLGFQSITVRIVEAAGMQSQPDRFGLEGEMRSWRLLRSQAELARAVASRLDLIHASHNTTGRTKMY
jgi:predicted metallo-beta-lactamase superfamily hydrolase